MVVLLTLCIVQVVGIISHNPVAVSGDVKDWGVGFEEEGKQPRGNATSEYLAQFDAYYVGGAVEKTIYLTFDAGFENGNTDPILKALKEKEVPAAFFLTGHYMTQNPELVKRMEQEGHIVGNHTMSHPDMAKISDKESLKKELEDLEQVYFDTTGKQMLKYYRPPEGKFSEANLKHAQELGYKTIFWSLAYVDWYENSQPTKEQAFARLRPRIHSGAIVLLHSTSSTNALILGELIDGWKAEGYTFKTLDDLCGVAQQTSASPEPLEVMQSK
ncbi:MAG: polysaccharide deacetylase family protein [Christensenellales bacterium]